MAEITKPIMLDETGQAINNTLLGIKAAIQNQGGGALDAQKYYNPNIKAVNHRGYCVAAPENTLSAFRLSKEKGYTYAECDVLMSSDGVPVLCHDLTLDRVSNGTGYLREKSFSELRELDFGGWFSDEFAGEKIPTLEEFIILCKWVGLHPYIEVKVDEGFTPVERANAAFAVVKSLGMEDNVTWISGSYRILDQIKVLHPKARLGYVVVGISDANIEWAVSAKNDVNDVFIDASYSDLTDSTVQKCIDNSIPLEVYTVNSEAGLFAINPYVSGYTTDSLLVNAILYGADIPETEVEPDHFVVVPRVELQGYYIKEGAYRAGVAYSHSDYPILASDYVTPSGYYFIPVPDGATGIKVNMPSDTRFAVRESLTTEPNANGKYTVTTDSGWKEAGSTHTFTNGAVYFYIVWAYLAGDAREIPADYDASLIVPEFVY